MKTNETKTNEMLENQQSVENVDRDFKKGVVAVVWIGIVASPFIIAGSTDLYWLHIFAVAYGMMVYKFFNLFVPEFIREWYKDFYKGTILDPSEDEE